MNTIDKETEEGSRLRRSRSERERAARYLDLWERHVGLTALRGDAPLTPSDPRAPWRGTEV